jgi:site-specific recombinase XerD
LKERRAVVSDNNAVQKYFKDLRANGHIALKPASTRLAPSPPVPEGLVIRDLFSKDVRYLFVSSDRSKPEGARDHAIILIICKVSLSVTEVAALKISSIPWSQGRPIIKFKAQGGRERILPLPPDVQSAIDHYLKLNRRFVEYIVGRSKSAEPIAQHMRVIDRTLDHCHEKYRHRAIIRRPPLCR